MTIMQYEVETINLTDSDLRFAAEHFGPLSDRRDAIELGGLAKAWEADLSRTLWLFGYSESQVSRIVEHAREWGTAEGCPDVRDADRVVAEACIPLTPIGNWHRPEFDGVWATDPEPSKMLAHLIETYNANYPGDVDAFLEEHAALMGYPLIREDVEAGLAVACFTGASERPGRTTSTRDIERIIARYHRHHPARDAADFRAKLAELAGKDWGSTDTETFLAIAWYRLGR